MFETTPAALNTTSHSSVSSPFLVFTVTLDCLPEVSTPVTSELVMILMPAFLRVRSSCLETSLSSTGTMRSTYSTTVTSVPMAL